MTWEIVFTRKAQKQIGNLDNSTKKRIKAAIDDKLLVNPALYLEPLSGELGNLYKFRVGDYRLICSKEEDKLIIIIVQIGHRSNIYKYS